MSDQERDEIVTRHGDLEIEENMGAQRRLWKIQRAGRAVAVLILALGLAGAFGGGPLSHQTASSGGCSIEYERIGYRDTSQAYRLKLSSEVARSGKVRVSLDNEALSRMQLDQIVPEPAMTRLTADGTLFEFEVEAGEGQREIRFVFQSEAAGLQTTRIDIESCPTIRLEQLFLP
ncbi:MAG TPA: hypothetical protein VF794_02755 [Archangium sp.]|jgi:hypothetical protein|uniref:hypothetical protein n=1 Tax=Archangium sp. TaxID=1872627 RepID=UPI002ED90141